jgi:RAD51-like protein 2
MYVGIRRNGKKFWLRQLQYKRLHTYVALRAAGMYYFRVHSFIEQIALVRQLSKFVAEHPNIKLVVIDSIGAE